jgi:1,4-dihydroxy-2-naphthoate octaprenyltransferase
MTFQGFLKLIEPRKRISCIIPLITGTVFSLYRYGSFKLENFLLILIFFLAFDTASTALNNYSDCKNSGKAEENPYPMPDFMEKYSLSHKDARRIITSFFLMSAGIGALLVLKTNIIVLIIISASFISAILYTWGPIPTKHTPFGEIVIGFYMGLIPIFLSIYLQVDINSFLKLSFGGIYHVLKFDIYELLLVILVSLPCSLCISNVYLAKNIYQMVENKAVNTHTLPHYIGKEKSLRLFSALYFMSYISIVILAILKAVPLISLLTLLTVFPLTVNLKLFYFKQTKKHTFSLSIKNFMLICVSYLATIAAGLFI